MSKVQVTSRFAVALAVLALAAGGCRDRGQALEAGAAKAPPAVVLAKDGLTAYTIVTGAQPLLAEQTAAKELAEYLGKVTGAEFKTVAENATGPQPAKAIYLGWTAFAASKGIECAKLGQEESVIRTVGDSLVITGGRPRGTIYGVYDFLQKDLGVYWLDHQTEVVPKRPTLALDALDRRAKPGFFYRHLYDVFLMGGGPFWPADPEMRQKVASFSARNRLNDKGRRFVAAMRPYGGVETYGSSYPVGHNFHFFVPGEKYFAEHPEYFAQDKSGKRQSCTGHNKGSLCLTHPEVRKIALARLLDVIAADRKEFPPGTPASPDQPPPSIYHFNQPDNDVFCHCPGCREMVAREGSESGPLIDFVNELADGVRDRYPEVRVMTAAYWWGMVPPKTLRPRDNVIIHWCNWYGFPGSNIPEPWQPLSSAVNAVRAENLRQWSAIAPGGLLIVEYGDCYTWPGFPFTSAPLLADNIRFLADNHAVGLWLHSEMHMPWEVNNERRGAEFFAYANGQFSPLYYWLAMQLMLDPRQPVEPLIATFMAGYYGPAAPTMRSLYDKLVAAVAEKFRSLRVGDPMNPETQLGAIVSREQHETVMRYIRAGSAEGARLVCGGKSPQGPEFEKGLFVEPTLFAGVTNQMRIAREEIFGPVLVAIPFDGEDEAVAIANDTPYGLGSGVFTKDLGKANRVLRRLHAGTVYVNTYNQVYPQSPFPGWKQSGIGVERGMHGLLENTRYKNVIMDISGRPISWF